MFKSDLLEGISWICQVQESIRMEDPPEPEVVADPPEPDKEEPPKEPVVEPAKDAPAWATGRIDDLTKNWREEERLRKATEAERDLANARIKELEAKVTPPEPGKTPPKPGAVPLSPEERTKQVNAEAERIVAAREFQGQLAAASEEGNKEFGEKEFTERCVNFLKIGGYTEAFLQTCLETGQASKILHKLGGDLDEASKILKMTPLKQAVALVKLADEVAKAPAVSGAPKPIKPVNGNGAPASDELTDDLPAAEWMRRRNKQVEGKTRH